MRIDSIALSWFRGAADEVALDTGCKSIVVYGENGSGKSSFVDAIEYILRNGKVGHLSHEYSGKRQEKGLPNTHTPEDETCALRVTLQDKSELGFEIQADGRSTRVAKGTPSLESWDYRRTVLRQHEVADFIHDTKSGKYSALLPLLGLHPLELTANNLRDLAKSLDDEARLTSNRMALASHAARRKEAFGADTDEAIGEKIERLHATYCPDRAATTDPIARCKELANALQARIDSSEADLRQHIALQDVAAPTFASHLRSVRAANAKLAAEADPLIREQVGVLETARVYTGRIGPQDEVACPACGRAIEVARLRAHVESEHARLEAIILTAAERTSAIESLAQAATALRAALGKPDLKVWRASIEAGPNAKLVASVADFDVDGLRANCTEKHLRTIEQDLVPLVALAVTASKSAPAVATQLASDKRLGEAAGEVFATRTTILAVDRAQGLVNFINSLERGVRQEILARTKQVIDSISSDVRKMWAILHPAKPIEDVRFYVPGDGDRAIEIKLKFHGVEQDSPRLTLSEGYRNGLGLCIFLAMAKREAESDRAVLLDDVVVSLDRNHRGMVVDLLDQEFGQRQVLLLTHDRDWYIELRHRLDPKRWTFKTLLPYDTPALGIRWSRHTTTFDDARAHLPTRPDSAANDVRKIMDSELANIAERLSLRLPYLRAEKNDKRTYSEFLERLIADGDKSFKRKVDGAWVSYPDAVANLKEASRLLVTTGNKGSHTTDVVPVEAIKLIDTCEQALERFTCSSCQKRVWSLVSSNSAWMQCECGELRWG